MHDCNCTTDTPVSAACLVLQQLDRHSGKRFAPEAATHRHCLAPLQLSLSAATLQKLALG